MAQELLSITDELVITPDEVELSRLVMYYPTYEWEHRNALLSGYFRGRTSTQLVLDKLAALNIDVDSCSGRSLGGHARWVRYKVKKTIVRLLYLRLRLDQKFSQVDANRSLLNRWGSDISKSDDAGQSALRKMTHSPLLDT